MNNSNLRLAVSPACAVQDRYVEIFGVRTRQIDGVWYTTVKVWTVDFNTGIVVHVEDAVSVSDYDRVVYRDGNAGDEVHTVGYPFRLFSSSVVFDVQIRCQELFYRDGSFRRIAFHACDAATSEAEILEMLENADASKDR
ncbi:MAG: hypothetical protein ACOCX3_03805 [Chloroflexota bacterium]